MTIMVALQYRTVSSVSVQLDLTAGIDGFRLLDWVPAMGDEDLPRPIETITVAVEGTSHNNLATKLQKLDHMARRVQECKNRAASPYMVRLAVKLDDETGTRYASVHRITSEFTRSLNRPPVSPGNFVDEYLITVERDHWWDQGVSGVQGFSFVSGIGDAANGTIASDYGELPDGDVGGNVAAQIISGRVTGDQLQANSARECWIGFRGQKIGNNRNQFEPVWNTSAPATQVSGDCTLTTVGGAITGSCYSCDFTLQSTMLARVYMQLSDVTSHAEDHRGTYLVLARLKCTGSRTYTGRMDYGFYLSTGSQMTAGTTFAIDQTNFYLYPMGYVSIPPERYAYQVGADAQLLQSFCIVFNAAVLDSGTGNLYIDAFILVPVDEGHVYVDNAWISQSYYTRVLWEPFGRLTAVAGLPTIEAPIATPIDWSLPIGKGVVVLVAQRADEHSKYDSFGLYIDYSRRYRTLRGSD